MNISVHYKHLQLLATKTKKLIVTNYTALGFIVELVTIISALILRYLVGIYILNETLSAKDKVWDRLKATTKKIESNGIVGVSTANPGQAREPTIVLPLSTSSRQFPARYDADYWLLWEAAVVIICFRKHQLHKVYKQHTRKLPQSLIDTFYGLTVFQIHKLYICILILIAMLYWIVFYLSNIFAFKNIILSNRTKSSI